MKTEILKPSLSNSNICIHPVRKFHEDKDYTLHFHSECEMYLCIKGEMTFFINGSPYFLSDGDIIFVNESIAHRTHTKKGTIGFLIQFRADERADGPDKYLVRYRSFQNTNAAVIKNGMTENKKIRDCLDEIIKENEEKAPCYDKYIKATVEKIIAILHRYDILSNNDEFFNSREITRLLPVIEYINLHFKEEMPLDKMSRLLNIDKSHFCRIFKRATNTSPIKYLNFVRICKAEKLLLKTDKSISQIAEETGFSSVSYFCETFKTHHLCAPSAYKKMKSGI